MKSRLPAQIGLGTVLVLAAWCAYSLFNIGGRLPQITGSGFSVKNNTHNNTLYFSMLLGEVEPEWAAASLPSISYYTGGFEDTTGRHRSRSQLVSVVLPPSSGSAVILSDLWLGESGSTCIVDEDQPDVVGVKEYFYKESQHIKAEGRRKTFDPPSAEFGGKRFYKIEFPESSEITSFTCKIKPLNRSVSFAGRAVKISHIFPGLTVGVPEGDEINYQNYESLFSFAKPMNNATRTHLDFEIYDSEGLSLRGGIVDDSIDPSKSRVVRPGDRVEAKWDNISLLQIRDLLLIILGALISTAIGLAASLLQPSKST